MARFSEQFNFCRWKCGTVTSYIQHLQVPDKLLSNRHLTQKTRTYCCLTNNTISSPSTAKANSFRNRDQDKQTHYSERPLTPKPHIPYEQTSSASACIRIPHYPAEPHRNTNTHRTRFVITYTLDIRIYSGNTIKNTLYTREFKDYRTPQQPILTETLIKTANFTTNHSPLNKDANAKTCILTEQYNAWNKSTTIARSLR